MTIQSPRAIDQVPSSLREAINQLFATRTWPTSKCDQMLEHLLRYACVEYQIVEQHNWHARIVIHNLLKTYYADCEMQEICCYQTLHIFVRLLCTLGILKKQECSGQPTTYLLPLDLGYCFQVSTVVLAEVDRLCNPEYTKNLKMRKKAQQVKERLLLMNPVLQSMQQRYENVGDLAREESPRREILWKIPLPMYWERNLRPTHGWEIPSSCFLSGEARLLSTKNERNNRNLPKRTRIFQM